MIALVLGSAACVWADVTAALKLTSPGLVVAVNDMIVRWPLPLDCAATLHPDKLPRWLAARQDAGLPAPRQVWCHRQAKTVTNVTADWRGASGLLALKIALYEHKCDGAILAGVPLDRSPHVGGGEPWKDAHAFYPGWTDQLSKIVKRARSMSGWTQLRLGAPTPEWLAEMKAAGPSDPALIALIERQEHSNVARTA